MVCSTHCVQLLEAQSLCFFTFIRTGTFIYKREKLKFMPHIFVIFLPKQSWEHTIWDLDRPYENPKKHEEEGMTPCNSGHLYQDTARVQQVKFVQFVFIIGHWTILSQTSTSSSPLSLIILIIIIIIDYPHYNQYQHYSS